MADTQARQEAQEQTEALDSLNLDSGSSPIMLFHEDIKGPITAVSAIINSRVFLRKEEDGRSRHINAEERIAEMVEKNGFVIMSVWIVREDGPSEIQHKVLTVLVKPEQT